MCMGKVLGCPPVCPGFLDEPTQSGYRYVDMRGFRGGLFDFILHCTCQGQGQGQGQEHMSGDVGIGVKWSGVNQLTLTA
jgi:hypothetical protein